MKISGTLRLDKRTKRLAKRLKKNEIALIDHTDLDSTAALMLVEAQAACIINVARSSSGRYPNLGPLKLLEHDIPLIDNADPAAFDILHEGDKVVVDNGSVYRDGELVVRGELLTKETVDKQLEDAAQNLGAELEAFINNTLNYMSNEINLILSTLTDREEKVIRLRFGLEDGRTRTLEEVGKEFDVTRERIRQIEAKAIRKLKQPTKSKRLREFLEDKK